MTKGIEAAVAALRLEPDRPVTAEIDGLVIELRLKSEATADDVFSRVGPWEGESTAELKALIREAREPADA